VAQASWVFLPAERELTVIKIYFLGAMERLEMTFSPSQTIQVSINNV